MAQTDVERLSRLMLDEFGRVHKRFDHQDDRFDRLERRGAPRNEFVPLRERIPTIEKHLLGIDKNLVA